MENQEYKYMQMLSKKKRLPFLCGLVHDISAEYHMWCLWGIDSIMYCIIDSILCVCNHIEVCMYT